MSDRAGAFPVFAAVASAFCVVLTFLALQVRGGADPAIGAGEPAERPLVIRRVVVERETGAVAPAEPAPEAAAPAQEPAAPAPAPEPAAPAPVTTQAS